MVLSLIATSSLSKKISDKLIAPFNTMTTFYFRRSVEKAFQLDEQPSDLSLNPKQSMSTNPPYITSAVDDVMYIVNQVVERSIATSQKSVILNVIPTITRVLGSDFIGMIQRKMRDESYPKVPVQGTPPAEHITIAFLVLINNLDVATEYVKRIVHTRLEYTSAVNSATTIQKDESRSLAALFPLETDAKSVANALVSLQNSFDGKTAELISDGIFVVFKNIIKPPMRRILTDAFRDVDYQELTDEVKDMGGAQTIDDESPIAADGPVLLHFERGWDMLTKPVARILTERNFEKLLTTVISYLGEVLEKRIWSYYDRISEMGAVKMERDTASIVNVVVRGGRYGLREAFARCTQICLIMNMENEEWEELQGNSDHNEEKGMVWKLSEEERKRARAMLKNRG